MQQTPQQNLAAEQQFHWQEWHSMGFYTGTIAWIIVVAPDSLETYSDREYYQLLTFVHKQEKHNIASLHKQYDDIETTWNKHALIKL